MKKSLVLFSLSVSLASACGGKKPERPRSSLAEGADAETGGNGKAGGGSKEDDKSIPNNDPKAKDGTNFFPGTETEASNRRIFRLTQIQLDQTAAFVFPGLKLRSVKEFLPIDPKQTNYDYADFLTINAASYAPYRQWAAEIAKAVEASPKSLVNCALVPPSADCHKKAVSAIIKKAFRGAAPAALEGTYFKFFEDQFVAQGDLGKALGSLSETILVAPEFLFRSEFNLDSKGTLIPGELRQNMAFLAADRPIDTLIGESADKETAANAAELALAHPGAGEKLEQFFVDWLELRSPEEMRISKEVYPEFTDALAKGAIAEARAFLKFYLSKPEVKLSDIVKSRKSFPNADTAVVYEADAGKGQGSEHDPAHRLGIFTQPAFLLSRSGPIHPNIVKRGVFFMRKVMCLETGLTPSGVDTTIDEGSGRTERERIEAKTGNAPCSSCHQLINPFGFAFENFDALGRWRTKEDGVNVDPKVALDFLGFEGVVAQSPVEAIERFTTTDRFKQCFVRQMFRYYMGRNELKSDDPTLKAMFDTLKSEDNVKKVLKTLVTSSRANQRK